METGREPRSKHDFNVSFLKLRGLNVNVLWSLLFCALMQVCKRDKQIFFVAFADLGG